MPETLIQVHENPSAPGWSDAESPHDGSKATSATATQHPDPVSLYPGPGSNWRDASPGGTDNPGARAWERSQRPVPKPVDVAERGDGRLPVMEGFVECELCGDYVGNAAPTSFGQTPLELHKLVKHTPGGKFDAERVAAASHTPEAKAQRSTGFKHLWANAEWAAKRKAALRQYWQDVRDGKRVPPTHKKKVKAYADRGDR